MSSCSNPSQLIPCATFGPKRPPDCLMLSKGGKILPFSDRFSCLASSQPALMTLLTHQNAQLKSVLTKKWNTARHASPVAHIVLTCSNRPKIARNEIESTFGPLPSWISWNLFSLFGYFDCWGLRKCYDSETIYLRQQLIYLRQRSPALGELREVEHLRWNGRK